MRPTLPFFAPSGGIITRKKDRNTYEVATTHNVTALVDTDTYDGWGKRWYVDLPHNILLADDERHAILDEARNTVSEYIDAFTSDAWVCKMCGGTGYLRDARQAWDIPEAPSPECPYCQGD